MARKRKFLHVRSHLDHLQIVLEGIQKHGLCPLIEDELKKLSLINRAIIRDHDSRRAAGRRHDLYVEKAR